MPTRTYTVVVERIEEELGRYVHVARVAALDGVEGRGRSAKEALARAHEAMVTALHLLAKEPDFDGRWPTDLKPRLVKMKVVLPDVRSALDFIVPPPDNVTRLKPRR